MVVATGRVKKGRRCELTCPEDLLDLVAAAGESVTPSSRRDF